MTKQNVWIPTFTANDIKRDTQTEQEAIQNEVVECLKSFELLHGQKDMFLILVRQAMDNNYKYGLACCSTENIDSLYIHVPNVKLPLITVGARTDIIKTLNRIINNKAFL